MVEGNERRTGKLPRKRNCKLQFDYDTLKKYFKMPLYLAAKKLGVSTTTLKKKCREHGLERWPHLEYLRDQMEKRDKIALQYEGKGKQKSDPSNSSNSSAPSNDTDSGTESSSSSRSGGTSLDGSSSQSAMASKASTQSFSHQGSTSQGGSQQALYSSSQQPPFVSPDFRALPSLSPSQHGAVSGLSSSAVPPQPPFPSGLDHPLSHSLAAGLAPHQPLNHPQQPFPTWPPSHPYFPSAAHRPAPAPSSSPHPAFPGHLPPSLPSHLSHCNPPSHPTPPPPFPQASSFPPCGDRPSPLPPPSLVPCGPAAPVAPGHAPATDPPLHLLPHSYNPPPSFPMPPFPGAPASSRPMQPPDMGHNAPGYANVGQLGTAEEVRAQTELVAGAAQPAAAGDAGGSEGRLQAIRMQRAQLQLQRAQLQLEIVEMEEQRLAQQMQYAPQSHRHWQ